MKRILPLLLMALLSVASLAHADTPEPQDVPHLHDMMTVVYQSQTLAAGVFDQGIRKNKSTISAIVLLQYNPAMLTEGNPQRASAGRVEVDCAAQTSKVLSAYALDGEGHVLREEKDQEKDLGKIRPESVIGKVAEFLCKQVDREWHDNRPETLGGHRTVTI